MNTPTLAQLFPDHIRDDETTLRAYSIDASIYKVRPSGVYFVPNEVHLLRVAQECLKRGIALTPRTSGTNLVGNALGHALVVDFSALRQMGQVKQGAIECQVGTVYNDLLEHLRPAGWFYGPDPSSGMMCRIGGMVANNSAGPHTLKYGAVKNKILGVRAAFHPFDRLTWVRSASEKETRNKVAAGEWPAGFLKIIEWLRRDREEIRSARVTVSKNSSGYNLFDLVDGLDRDTIPWHFLLVGSEGTLALFTEADLALDRLPPFVQTFLVYFTDMESLAVAVNRLRPLKPSAMEMLDSHTMDLIGRQKFNIPTNADTMLIIEIDEGDPVATPGEVQRILDSFSLAAPIKIATEKGEREKLWAARKAIFPTLYKFSKELKPINFVDDVVVAAERIPDLIRYLQTTFRAEGIPVAIYGHIGDGNAHINPLMNLRGDNQLLQFQKISDAIHRKVIQEFHGSICGEHGDGRVRGHYIRELYGERIYQLFVAIKRELDPRNILNPGVKIEATGWLSAIDLERVAGDCATCGKCNAVCPVYDIRHDESMSARGWWHLLNKPDFDPERDARAHTECINCKSCREVCPVGLDVSEKVLDIRASNPPESLRPLFWFLSRPYLHRLLTLGAPFQGILDNPLARDLLYRVSSSLLGGMGKRAAVHPDYQLPRLSTTLLRDRHPDKCSHRFPEKNRVAYFHGCAANLFADGVGDEMIRILTSLGVDFRLPPQVCSGTPLETYGFIDMVRQNALYNLRQLRSYRAVVTGCASCTLKLLDYPRLFAMDSPEHRIALEVAGKVHHIGDYIQRHYPHRIRKSPAGGESFTYHSSCHLRVTGQSTAVDKIFQSAGNFIPMAHASRCAGGAGTFNIKDFPASMAMFQRKADAIQKSGAKRVVTSCPACSIQLRTGLRDTKTSVHHLVEILRELID